jgi:FkbM family methyltransferase
VVRSARMRLKHGLRRAARRVGYDVTPFDAKWSPVARRGHLLGFLAVDLVLDVGANTGQYGYELRSDLGYRGRIVSFEPLGEAYRELRARAVDDPTWRTFNVGLGDEAGRFMINVAANAESSSMLEMLPAHAHAERESRFVGTQEIEVTTLDEIFDEVTRPGDRVYLKIDTQGFEGRVLRGADRSLRKIDTIQLEMSLTPLYDGEAGFFELSRLLVDHGYVLFGLEPGFSDPRSGRLLQVDGIFHRES